MNSMDDEADPYHRLITSSLEKLADSQKKNCSLHKNLLITNILQKAYNYDKETKLSDSFTSDFKETTISHSELSMDFYPKDQVNAANSTEISSDHSLTLTCFDAPPLSQVSTIVSEPVNPLASSHINNLETSHINSNLCLLNSPNSSPEFTFNESLTISKNHLKRKRSYDAYEEHCSRAKRLKETENNIDPAHLTINHDPNFNWRCSAEKECDLDFVENFSFSEEVYSSFSSDGSVENNMDVDQLCGLISVFQNGFQGLVENYNDQDVTHFSLMKSPQEAENISPKEQKFALRKGHSLPDLCAKEAAEHLSSRSNFDLCTSPLALTV